MHGNNVDYVTYLSRTW